MPQTAKTDLIQWANKLNHLSIGLIYIAIVCFVLFGTLASLAKFKDSPMVYGLFHYLPYALIGLTIPASLFVALVLWRSRISDASILLVALLVAGLLFILSPFVAFCAWIGVAFMFKANLKRFYQFLQSKQNSVN